MAAKNKRKSTVSFIALIPICFVRLQLFDFHSSQNLEKWFPVYDDLQMNITSLYHPNHSCVYTRKFTLAVRLPVRPGYDDKYRSRSKLSLRRAAKTMIFERIRASGNVQTGDTIMLHNREKKHWKEIGLSALITLVSLRPSSLRKSWEESLSHRPRVSIDGNCVDARTPTNCERLGVAQYAQSANALDLLRCIPPNDRSC